MGPADLSELLHVLEAPEDKRMLVPPGDDAGVFLLNEDTALVETVDVITPLVNDPYLFGRISATNSLSDIYAMGGTPLTCLAIFGFSSCDYEMDVFELVLKGAMESIALSGACLLGGHSFEDREMKFGLSVTGIVRPQRVLRKEGAAPGDHIILTKPVGTGVLTTALKGGKVDEDGISEAIKWMCTLNAEAARVALSAHATACTDVTGFGLLGHACNMLRDTEVDFHIRLESVPVFEGVREFVEMGIVPEGAYNNLNFHKSYIDAPGVEEESLLILSDPQTSGGLLFTIKPGNLHILKESGLTCWRIGEVRQGSGRIIID
ncbi:MAG TPA: selenide, water dikinase SelD [Nitrospirae bacterium]|nr:selenide, water dikinase SelD [Nitrospirota bacterium]